MKLCHTPTSPFVRKVMIVAHETGLIGRVELVPTNPWAPDSDIGRTNPLGKVPALVTDGGEHLFDSPVICEYLDSLHEGAKLFPVSGGARWNALRRQATADGLLDAGVARRLELTLRPAERRWDVWIERQGAAMERGLDLLESEAVGLEGLFTIGEISIVCALGWFDFRIPELGWRFGRPALAKWYERQLDRPSVAATLPHE